MCYFSFLKVRVIDFHRRVAIARRTAVYYVGTLPSSLLVNVNCFIVIWLVFELCYISWGLNLYYIDDQSTTKIVMKIVYSWPPVHNLTVCLGLRTVKGVQPPNPSPGTSNTESDSTLPVPPTLRSVTDNGVVGSKKLQFFPTDNCRF